MTARRLAVASIKSKCNEFDASNFNGAGAIFGADQNNAAQINQSAKSISFHWIGQTAGGRVDHIARKDKEELLDIIDEKLFESQTRPFDAVIESCRSFIDQSGLDRFDRLQLNVQLLFAQ